MSKEKPLDGLDAILYKLGPFGKYTIINFVLFLFPSLLSGSYISVFVFEASDIHYRCEIKECENAPNTSLWLKHAIPKIKNRYSKCERHPFIKKNIVIINNTCTADIFNTAVTEKCSSYVYSDEDSAVKDFNLGCQDWKRTLIGTIRNSGQFVSLPLCGLISDRFGRKVALSISALVNCVVGLMRSFSTTYIMMIALEFMETGFGGGAFTTTFVLAMELVGPKGRVLGSILLNIVYICGLMSLAGLSWILQDWRKLLKILYAPSCLVFSYIWILNESIRWLLSKGRHDEAIAIIKKAAKMNKVEISDQALEPLQEMEKKRKEDKEEIVIENKPVHLQVIQSRIIRNRLFSCSFLWITCTFVYYGLLINSVSLAGNKYANFMLVAFIEIPANFTCLFVLDRFGRKKVLSTTYILSAVLCISLLFLPKGKTWLSLIIYLSGKFSITISYSSVYIYVSEVFPTNVRQSLIAICSTCGRIGSSLAPLTPLLALYSENLQLLFFGTLAVIAGLLVTTLPETINIPLPDSVEEAEMIAQTKRPKNQGLHINNDR